MFDNNKKKKSSPNGNRKNMFYLWAMREVEQIGHDFL